MVAEAPLVSARGIEWTQKQAKYANGKIKPKNNSNGEYALRVEYTKQNSHNDADNDRKPNTSISLTIHKFHLLHFQVYEENIR